MFSVYLTDMCAPPLPYICPSADLETEQSLGNILGAAHVTETLIKQHAILHKRNEYLTMLSMLKGENAFTYPPHTETQVTELLSELRKMADYIIIDCIRETLNVSDLTRSNEGAHGSKSDTLRYIQRFSGSITNDVLSAVSVIEADAVLRLVSCDLKAISYLNSQMPLLLDNKFNIGKQYKAVSNVDAFQADENIEQIVGGVSFKIPHSDEVRQQFLSGNLFAGLSQKDSKDFRRAVSKIANEVYKATLNTAVR